jgi:hypothetical protein
MRKPDVQLFELLGSQLVDSPVCDRMHLDETSFTKYAEMSRNLRLAQPKPIGDFPHR